MTADAASGRVPFGDFERRIPISSDAADRGTPLDRYYVERFLALHADDIRGCVLEVGGHAYTQRLGGSRVTRAHTLTTDSGTGGDDLTDLLVGDAGQFDCVLLPQTLRRVYNIGAAIQRAHNLLAPDGVILATLPGISRLPVNNEPTSQYWAFTSQSARRAFADVFVPERVAVSAHGNVLAAIALMQGLAASELTAIELAHVDPAYEIILGVRATRTSVPG